MNQQQPTLFTISCKHKVGTKPYTLAEAQALAAKHRAQPGSCFTISIKRYRGEIPVVEQPKVEEEPKVEPQPVVAEQPKKAASKGRRRTSKSQPQGEYFYTRDGKLCIELPDGTIEEVAA